MLKAVNPTHPKRLLFASLLIVTLAYLFWTGSRYPDLDDKAIMSGAIQLEDALSFEAKFQITPDMGMIERIFWSTLNWVNTNKKGMTFGILFAAAFLTAASYLRRRSFSGGFANSLLGLAIGTPLGVCVNCAAPIARGMYSSGMRAETVLSAMIASPTLNILVLTMTFSLLPVYMALTKIALSLVVILVAVPLLCRLLPEAERAPAPAVQPPTHWSTAELNPAQGETLLQALFAVTLTFARNLWYIIRLTVPLMLLAGFLGTIGAILLPPELVTGLDFALWVLVPLALVGLFLPVPIAFDVVVTGALLGLGMSQGYVMALLFTLGTFSIYSFFIVAQSLSLRAALMLAGTILVLGILGGIGAQTYHDWQSRRALELLLSADEPRQAPGFWAAEAATLDSTAAGKIEITSTPFASPSPAGEAPFTRIEASRIGIDKPVEFSFRDMWPPFWEGRSLAAGDIDNDGDIDLVIASTEIGLYAYANDGKGSFSRLALEAGPLDGAPVFNAVLADIDNDGWRDLFVATYRQGNFLIPNRQGQLDTAHPQPVANRPDAVLTLALSLGDPDRDGDLDIALGNWAAGWYRRVPGEESRNRILWNENGQMTGAAHSDLPAIPGETLSILFSDIDGDGDADLLEGNDFEIPDALYLGDGAGGFRQITHQDGLVPHTTTTTMAVKSADLTGDGMPEIYLAQIAGRSSGASERLKMQPLERYCDGIEDARAAETCRRNMAIKTWYKSGNNFDPTYAARCQELSGRDQVECKAMLVKDLAIQQHDPSICDLIPANQPIPRAYCQLHFRPARQVTAAEAEASIQQILRANVLLEAKGALPGAGWSDSAKTRGLDVGGWSWDTKVEDFDLDGDLDVYIVNGTWVPNEVSPSNLYFENDSSGHFTESSGPMGLEDYLMTAAAVAFDADGDGDLDMLTHPVNGPLVFFRNNAQGANAVAFALEDHIGNRDGIGAVIEIEDDLGHVQRREIQLGGGFMSFDAPLVHFGLGEATEVVRVAITWADGDWSDVERDLRSGHLHRITRKAS
ncbi:FG-GAP-like repeat-containing protein [Ruegeria aquimaris]|uniref:FG-GAP-like repeat-containing protein n=1 Tax=Ruegeria aquimaris TaxID=2984333 RepID=A0ABT3ASR2_9RHOB|nr:FG-GAP-like repeat-containing protein [Ruegeria sp. XHP0148]MCV2891181.1 FG-GAP-like repeat-containing protein [Ruegeria sp. XHP0148]